MNWERIPNSLFGRAWITTGHITEEELLANSTITAEELAQSHLLQDPLELSAILGAGNDDEPSLEELILQGSQKRKRVQWVLDGRDGPGVQALLPATLVFPVEKRLCHFLYHVAKHPDNPPQARSTLVLNRRTGREATADALRKHTVLGAFNLRALKPDAPARAVKDCGFFQANNFLFITYTISIMTKERASETSC